MTQTGYLILGWTFTSGTIILYSLSIFRRARRVVALVPADRRRWVSSAD